MRHLAVLVAAAALIGCDSDTPSEPQGFSVMGAIEFYDDSVQVSVPDTVAVGETFAVSVRTYGDGCVEKGSTEVQVNDLSATVTPFDRHSGAEACPDVLRTHEHQATLAFEEPGDAVVTFRGRSVPRGGIRSVARTVVVE